MHTIELVGEKSVVSIDCESVPDADYIEWCDRFFQQSKENPRVWNECVIRIVDGRSIMLASSAGVLPAAPDPGTSRQTPDPNGKRSPHIAAGPQSIEESRPKIAQRPTERLDGKPLYPEATDNAQGDITKTV